jgi:4-amino-4-deoxy-L-arabinose transferase-like glycosyltransferase
MSAVYPLAENPPGLESRSLKRLRWVFGAVLLLRLLYPIFNSPLSHLFSDPGRHWENGQRLLNPTFMGSGDPYLYQVFLWLLIQIKGNVGAVIGTGVGVLCAAMPYGWYLTLKELLPKKWALGAALLMALVPGFLGAYAYFMNETLLLSLTGFAFWATFRAQRKRSVGAFVLACALWLAAGFTRTVALPMALPCLLSIWLPQPLRLPKAGLGVMLLLIFAVPAALHAHVNLGFYAPFGNPYLQQIYQVSGNKTIDIELGPKGRYEFGSPSFYNPSFYPFSNWTTDRGGTVSITIDTSRGRADWIAEKQRVAQSRTFPQWRGYWENFVYLAFGQSWPDNDRASFTGWATVWSRWIWFPLVLVVAAGAARGVFRGREWLLPLCGLGLFLYLMVQQQGVMEARYRKPLDPVMLAAAVVMVYRYRDRLNPLLLVAAAVTAQRRRHVPVPPLESPVATPPPPQAAPSDAVAESAGITAPNPDGI